MQLARNTFPICRAAFWLVFAIMLIAMFGFRDVHAQHVSAACAALIVLAVAIRRPRSRYRAA